MWKKRSQTPEQLQQTRIYRKLSEIPATEHALFFRLARQYEHCFAGSVNDLAAEFYYNWGQRLKSCERYDEAKAVLQKCLSIRIQTDGRDGWFTEIVRWNIAMIDVCWSDAAPDAMAFLNRFADRLLSGFYGNAISVDMQCLVLGETIQLILMKQAEGIDEPERYTRLLEQYEQICRDYPDVDPLISMRLAWNHRGALAIRSGDFAEAENNFMNALECECSDAARDILSDGQICSNLLSCAMQQNDDETFFAVYAFLKELQEQQDGQLNETDRIRIQTYLSTMVSQLAFSDNLDVLPEDMQQEAEAILEALPKAADDFVRELAAGMPVGGTLARQRAVLFLSVMAWLPTQRALTQEERQRYLQGCRLLEQSADEYQLTGLQHSALYLTEALLNAETEPEMACRYARKAVDSMSLQTPLQMQVSIFGTAGLLFAKAGQKQCGISYTRRSLDARTALWHQYLYYLDDSRLAGILAPQQLAAVQDYAILRKEAELEAAYDALLKLKCLASLAGRERNRILHSSGIHSPLMEEIRQLQDSIARMESAALFGTQPEQLEEQRQKLRSLENSFTAEFPESDRQFTEISWERVAAAIPEDSAVLEYYFAVDDYAVRNEIEDAAADALIVLDVYIAVKRQQRVSLQRVTVLDAAELLEDAGAYVDGLQQKHGREDLKGKLYQALVAPVLPYIEDLETIAIAPDGFMINLPVELLEDDENERLAASHSIVKLECARDYLFFGGGTPAVKGNLIIANPQYRVPEQEPASDGDDGASAPDRFMAEELTDLPQLPYAELEAKSVADFLEGMPVTGTAARKTVLTDAAGYEHIHIATHGFFDISGETNSIYSSALAFSGVSNWVQTGRPDARYGNGLVTADEISRLDLRSARLVVVSSCLSGRSQESMSMGYQGLIGAFAAAGAGYVLAHLWSEPDALSTVILMNSFYYFYREAHFQPPEALANAQNYLRNLTVGAIRAAGWLDYARQNGIVPDQLEQEPDGFKPYKNELYWGGFACYHCN